MYVIYNASRKQTCSSTFILVNYFSFPFKLPREDESVRSMIVWVRVWRFPLLDDRHRQCPDVNPARPSTTLESFRFFLRFFTPRHPSVVVQIRSLNAILQDVKAVDNVVIMYVYITLVYI